MFIRKTTIDDLPSVMAIYSQAQQMMRESGNPNQWGINHPPRTLIETDIQNKTSHVCVSDNKIVGVFYFNIELDPTYNKINGEWVNNEQYGVVHRIARGKAVSGIGRFCLDWCFSQHPNIKIDTHRDNAPMITLLNKLGFVHCGVIWLENGDERLAFQKTN